MQNTTDSESNKITNEQIEASELYSLGEAIGDGLELNAKFIKRYCGEQVAAQLLRVPKSDRDYVLDGFIGEGYFPGTIIGNLPDAIVLPCDEIEYQFEGNAADVFATPEDLTINGDLAYLYTGYGAVFTIDITGLTKAIDEHLAD